MRIGIITLFGNANYGNKYQNYALQKVLEEVTGAEVETLSPRYPLPSSPYNFAVRCYVSLIKVISLLKGKKTWKKKKAFKKFNKRWLHIYNFISMYGHTPKRIARRYDYFVVGSDQVWNPNNRKTERDLYYLTFADRKQRRNISPSFGVEKMPEMYISEIKPLLNGFDTFSCRESAGVEIIKEMTEKDATLLIDPSLALDKEQWMQIAEKVEAPERYVLLAFLGPKPAEVNSLTDKLKTEGCEMVDALKSGKTYTPEEMLYLLANAALVLTDSFHFTAFSINFNTPFLSFHRGGSEHDKAMFSRIASILTMFKMEDREYGNKKNVSLFNTDFSFANQEIKNAREIFIDYVRSQFV